MTPSPTGEGIARCLVVGPYIRIGEARAALARADFSARTPEARLDEATGLARAIDLEVVHTGVVMLSTVRPATYLGKGKVEELAGLVKSLEIELVVMDCALSPVQQRNLEKAWGAKVLDRTGLILEIFGRRAATREGTLQVELAHLTYQKSRLVRSWTHLERQRGGFGFLGGPGETQIETDRRLIQDRIRRIEHELEGVKRTRSLHRTSRKRVPYPIVALVGYTNAGKSTLFNRLTRSGVLAADMLFATLDPTLRSVDLPNGPRVILSDTVGFISDLPTMLVAAFRATLEEVIEADLILHVRDVSHGDTQAQSRDVDKVLDELGIPPEDERILEVWNKIDQLSAEERERLENLAARQAAERRPMLVSAVSGEGLDTLVATISERVARTRVALTVEIDASDGAALSWLHRNGDVLDTATTEAGVTTVHLRVHPSREGQVRAKFGERVHGMAG
ncbi:GTPase HflX [Rhodoplanes roseus]|uniref:GTPase HflX n=2 Tax=Rhodoplanes roseus TaxID=29409 RepID=A0A327L6Y9_9BRAD|nr:GTPase HflX [Rhodoplanes roseus]RAI43428.1 GTPase HflX [Rhodoplanes roseus]